jgi:hypothetical protein
VESEELGLNGFTRFTGIAEATRLFSVLEVTGKDQLNPFCLWIENVSKMLTDGGWEQLYIVTNKHEGLEGGNMWANVYKTVLQPGRDFVAGVLRDVNALAIWHLHSDLLLHTIVVGLDGSAVSHVHADARWSMVSSALS